MNIEELRAYCLTKPMATEDFPFDETTLVVRVMGKMFALIDLEKNQWVCLKCDPEKALDLRDQYPDTIQEAFHMNKKHWNQVRYESSLSNNFLCSLIDHSYELVIGKFTRKMRDEYNSLLKKLS
ncbi:MAG: MmcQ/YjbR family DNA-binding protein [Bacteroidaceae bacterium]|nr:MmcQ/YjbR family DNA-binding protein [Bacteroidaceae bacterium]MBP9637168.1 MmcQ/YjbR family DNA-binding protein [Bacteroidaceae bacterium]